MSLILIKCIEFDENRKICIASEKGKTFRIENNTGIIVRKIKVDKCIAQNIGEKRCDYLITFNDGKINRAIFIELKGSGLSQAIKQLLDTVIYLKREFKNYRIDARIVGSSDFPGLKFLPDYRKLARELLPTQGTIKIGTNNIYTETI